MDQIPSTWNPSGRGGPIRPHEERFLQEARFSAQGWVDESCREQLRRILPRLIAGLSDYGARLVFLSGSAGLGEAVGWEGEERFVLSDLDLGVVVWHPVPPHVTAKLTAQLEDLADPAGAEVGFGLYPADSLPRQVATPGAVDFLNRPCPLWGDAKAFGAFPAFAPGSLPPWEAFRLVGNRCRELLLAPGLPSAQVKRPSPGELPASGYGEHPVTELGDERANVESLYRVGKWIDGLATACFVAQGRYLVGRARRWGAVADGSFPIPAEIRRAQEIWQPFLERPSPQTRPAQPPAESIAAGHAALSAFFREVNPESTAAAVEEPYLQDPRTVADRLRAWRAVVRDEPDTSWGWLLRSGLRGSPDVRRLGAAVLYWLSFPEDPEPDWGTVGEGAKDVGLPPRAELWSRVERLLGDRIEPGAGAKNELRRRLGWDGATASES